MLLQVTRIVLLSVGLCLCACKGKRFGSAKTNSVTLDVGGTFKKGVKVTEVLGENFEVESEDLGISFIGLAKDPTNSSKPSAAIIVKEAGLICNINNTGSTPGKPYLEFYFGRGKVVDRDMDGLPDEYVESVKKEKIQVWVIDDKGKPIRPLKSSKK